MSAPANKSQNTFFFSNFLFCLSQTLELKWMGGAQMRERVGYNKEIIKTVNNNKQQDEYCTTSTTYYVSLIYSTMTRLTRDIRFSSRSLAAPSRQIQQSLMISLYEEKGPQIIFRAVYFSQPPWRHLNESRFKVHLKS